MSIDTLLIFFNFISDVYIEADDVPVTGFVDTVNLTALRLSVVMLDEPSTITGNLSFTGSVTFLADIDVTGWVHGLDFERWAAEVVTINTTQVR